MIRLRAKLKMLQLKRVITLLFGFGLIGMIFIKRFRENLKLSITEDEAYTRRLPRFLIIGAKKCGTCEQNQP